MSLSRDLTALSPREARRNVMAGNFFTAPLFREMRCAITGSARAASPIRKYGLRKEKFKKPHSRYLSAMRISGSSTGLDVGANTYRDSYSWHVFLRVSMNCLIL